MIVTVVVSVAPAESVTVNVSDTGEALAVVGVPEITPVEVFNVNPVGNVPVVRANVYGATPPDAARVVEYETSFAAAGIDVVVRSSGVAAAPTTVKLNELNDSMPPCLVMVLPLISVNDTMAIASHMPAGKFSLNEQTCPDMFVP